MTVCACAGVYGQLGRGREDTAVDTPRFVQMPEPIRDVMATAATLVSFGGKGTVYGCGRSLHGLLNEQDTPVFFPTPFGIKPGIKP